MAEVREKVFMAGKLQFTEEDMELDENLGYPRVYARLCRSANTNGQGPPSAFLPYALQPHETARVKEFYQIFPIVNPEATPSANPRTFINLLWKQLSHLGNAGFDPALFRVDPYGNVLYFHADSASPLYWDIDHWFPCSRGGRTVLSNLRLLQWQVCKKKHNKLEFLIPWWDLQLGISVNQFLCIFASRNSDFRNRGFSFLFEEGGNEELNELEVVESHKFPQGYLERKRHLGLAPAALTSSQRYPDASLLKPLSLKGRPLRLNSPSLDDREGFGKAIHRSWPSMSKENDNPNICGNESNPYLSIALARDSLREKKESKKKQAEMRGLEDELGDLRQKNEAERVALQDLEAALIRKRRRVEKCRRLAEAQASYKAQLEKMIRDAMHQSVVYKEQVRLNQAACNTLVARLEAQKAVLDASEQELLKKYKQRDELEKQIIPFSDEHGRKKRSWTDETPHEGGPDDSTHLSHSRRRKIRKALRKELRVFLEEEQKASEAGMPFDGGFETESLTESSNSDDGSAVNCKLKGLTAGGQGPKESVSEERITQLGKRNVEKWLQILLNKAEVDHGPSSFSSPPRDTAAPENKTEELVHKLNTLNPQKQIKFLRLKPSQNKEEEAASAVPSEKSNVIDIGRQSVSSCKGNESSRSLDLKGRTERKDLVRPYSQTSRHFPSSPLILGVRRGIDCISKKPLVIGDDADHNNLVDENHASRFDNSCKPRSTDVLQII